MESAQASICDRRYGQIRALSVFRRQRRNYQLAGSPTMDKFAIATILEEIGSMLEMKGENPFKSRAYHNASRVVAGLNEDLNHLVKENKLCEIKGLGKSMCGHIEGLLATGRDSYYEEL